MTSFDGNLEFLGEEVAEAGRVEHAGHADDLVVRQAREFSQRPDHRVERVGDADDERVRCVGGDPFADRLHDLQVDAEQIVTAHAGLARHAGGDDNHIGAGDIGIIVRPDDLGVEALDRGALAKIERLALRHAFDHVEQHDIAETLERREVRERAADVAGADQRDLLAGHSSSFSMLPKLPPIRPFGRRGQPLIPTRYCD